MIGFIILHYNVFDETKNCVESILKNIKNSKKIIIVDNGSSNNSAKELEKYYKENSEVEIIETNKNLGFANGNNFGYAYAKKKYDMDFCVVMNNDMEILQEDFVDKIYNFYNKDKFDILGPDIFSTKLKYHQNPQAQRNYKLNELIRFRNILFLRNKFPKLFFGLSNIKQKLIKPKIKNKELIKQTIFGCPLHGACYIFSRRFLDNHNKCFFDKTFMYQESYILHYLATQKNEVIVYYPEIQVLHHEDVATDSVNRKKYEKYKFINKCLYDSTTEFIKLMKGM